jgi:DNA (cytosine-5)-methyltransferase 1
LDLPPHPKRHASGSLRRLAARLDKPIAVDLFAGCGGLSLGLEQAGYAVILAVDNDPRCVESHQHNLPGLTLDLDLADPVHIQMVVELLEGVPVDLVAGGPPCQPFSRAGHAKLRSLVKDGARPEHDERRELWQSFLEVVEGVRPAAVLMENVPDMALGDDLMIVRAMVDRLEASGYEVDARLLDAWRHGVPQHRQRLILVGLLDGRPFRWPAEGRRVDLRAAISDLPSLGDTTGSPEMRAGTPRTDFQRQARVGMNGNDVVWDHVTRPVRADDREAFRLMKPGTRYSDLPKRLRRYRADIFDDKYNRLNWDDVCRSITAHIAKDGYWYIHPSEQRTLTVREAARVQTFPDRFRFAGSRSHAFRQIGNAVPPVLAEAVGRELRKAASRPPLPKPLRESTRLSRIRTRVLNWAKRDARVAPWRHPGNPWHVLAGVVLGDRVGASDEAVGAFLKRFPSYGSGVETLIRKAAREQRGTVRKGYERMARAAKALNRCRNSWASAGWIDAAELGDAEEALVLTVGCSEDRVLVSAPILRVVARLTETDIDLKRRLSDGRMVVGRLIGSGSAAPGILAALQAVGRSICTPDEPDCTSCPVNRYCKSNR